MPVPRQRPPLPPARLSWLWMDEERQLEIFDRNERGLFASDRKCYVNYGFISTYKYKDNGVSQI